MDLVEICLLRGAWLEWVPLSLTEIWIFLKILLETRITEWWFTLFTENSGPYRTMRGDFEFILMSYSVCFPFHLTFSHIALSNRYCKFFWSNFILAISGNAVNHESIHSRGLDQYHKNDLSPFFRTNAWKHIIAVSVMEIDSFYKFVLEMDCTFSRVIKELLLKQWKLSKLAQWDPSLWNNCQSKDEIEISFPQLSC